MKKLLTILFLILGVSAFGQQTFKRQEIIADTSRLKNLSAAPGSMLGYGTPFVMDDSLWFMDQNEVTYNLLDWLDSLAALGNTYLKRDGTTSLLADWAAGAFKISNTDSIQSPVLKATSNAAIESATPTLRLTDSDTGADSYVSASSAAGSIFIQADQNNEVAGSVIRFDNDGASVGSISSTGLEIINVSNLLSDPDKFLVLDGSKIVKYRTGSQLLSDILTGGVNKYLTEWTATNALDTAFIYHDGNEYRVNTITDNGAYQWQVAGGGYFGGNVRLASASPRLDFLTGGTKQWQIGTPSGTTRFSFFEDGADERFVIEAGGGFGNMTDPLAKFDVAVTSSDGSSSSHGIRVNTGGASPFSTQIGASTSGYGWIQTRQYGVAYTGLSLNPNGGEVWVNYGSDPGAYAFAVNGNTLLNGTAKANTSFETPAIKITTGATDGYFLRGDADGDAVWASIGAVLVWKGTVDGSTGYYNGTTDSLIDGTGTAGWYYRVVVAGTHDYGNPSGNSITSAVGDGIIYNGTIWQKDPGQGYTLQAMTADVLGGAKLGGSLQINSEVLNVNNADMNDITVSGTGADVGKIWTIDNDVVTYAKIQNVSAQWRVLGRSSSGAGDVEEITMEGTGQVVGDISPVIVDSLRVPAVAFGTGWKNSTGAADRGSLWTKLTLMDDSTAAQNIRLIAIENDTTHYKTAWDSVATFHARLDNHTDSLLILFGSVDDLITDSLGLFLRKAGDTASGSLVFQDSTYFNKTLVIPSPSAGACEAIKFENSLGNAHSAISGYSQDESNSMLLMASNLYFSGATLTRYDLTEAGSYIVMEGGDMYWGTVTDAGVDNSSMLINLDGSLTVYKRATFSDKITVADSVNAENGYFSGNLGVGAKPGLWDFYSTGQNKMDSILYVFTKEIGKENNRIEINPSDGDLMRIRATDLAGMLPLYVGGNGDETGGLKVNADASIAHLTAGGLKVGTINHATTDLDKFLVNHGDTIKYRTGAELLSDIGGQAAVTPAALTKTDDTNVTLTLGGSPTTALLQATSITAGWTGQLSVARGGTGLATVAANSYLKGNGTSALVPRTYAEVLTDLGLAAGGLLLPTGTEGQTLYNNGGVWTANSNLFWDDVNIRLGVNTVPLNVIDAVIASSDGTSSSHGVRFQTGGASPYSIQLGATTSGFSWIQSRQYGVGYTGLALNPNGGEVWINYTSDPGAYNLAVNGATLINGALALGANNLTMTGSLGATAARVTKGWFTDLEVTNTPTINGTAMSSIFAGVAQIFYLGTTSIAINRGSAAQSLTGITSIDGSAAKLTTARTIGGTSFDGTANIKIGALSSTNVDATTSAQLAGVLSDETGTDKLVYNTNPTLVGFTATGNGLFNDNIQGIWGTGSDLKIYHDGTSNQIQSVGADMEIGNGTTTSEYMRFYDNSGVGFVTLRYNGAEVLRTTTGGVSVYSGYNYYLGSSKYNLDASTAGTTPATWDGDDVYGVTRKAIKAYVAANSGGAPGGSSTEMQYNNAGVFDGVSFLTVNEASSRITLNSDKTFYFGNSFVYDTGNSLILCGYSSLHLGVWGGSDILSGVSVFNSGGHGVAVLYYDGAEKLTTTSTGVSVTGSTNSTTGFSYNGTSGATVTKTVGSDQVVVQGGIITSWATPPLSPAPKLDHPEQTGISTTEHITEYSPDFRQIRLVTKVYIDGILTEKIPGQWKNLNHTQQKLIKGL